MTSELSNLAQLFLEIQKRAAEVADSNDSRPGLDTLLVEGIAKAMEEIRQGADPDEFQELAVLNLIISATDKGYFRHEIKDFVKALKQEN